MGVLTAEFSIALRYRDGLCSAAGKVRVEVLLLVDVVGERLGDMSSAGILHLLLTGDTGVNFKYTLLVVASLGTALWICSEWLLRRVYRMKAVAERDNEIQLPLQKLAREGAVLA
ncbi:MAG TPA: hypothetical protein VI386_24555 [Candidatus Sulfotelmatobacter sp.]